MLGLNAETIVLALAFSAAASLITWLVVRRQVAFAEQHQNHLRQRIKELEEAAHGLAREHLQQMSQLESRHYEEDKQLRARAIEEGRALGLEEAKRSHVSELTAAEIQYAQKISEARDAAYQEARVRTKTEFEAQSKLYDVSVRPYLKIDTVSGLFGDKEHVEVGYQYQLLVNGLPAFQPAVIIEESRTTSKLNEERIRDFLATAQSAAKTAAEMYLGAGASIGKLGPAVLKRLAK